MRTIKKVGFVIKPHAPNIEKVLKQLIFFFQKNHIECVLEKFAANKIKQKKGVRRLDVPGKVDMVMVLGGDGTLLSIAHLAARSGVPVLGVNMGSLGFLTEVPLDEMFLTLQEYLKGNDSIVSHRQMLEVTHQEKSFLCLNDIVINKGALARMISCEIRINQKKVAAPRLDGIIISTPTGSTAYSLSTGGPIIQPHIPAMIICPICPHTLTFRPMVISSESEVMIKVLSGGEKAYLTLDGQRGNLVKRNQEIKIKSSNFALSLISSPERNYFDLVQEKLGWGLIKH
ncbi:MAG: transposase [Candidatus Aminicenantes bacterium]|nr:transposase [Candidatus Aminicenantes bacterium]